MLKKERFWKRSISLLLVFLLAVTSMPQNAASAAEVNGKLVNIADEASVSTYDNSTAWGNSPDFVNDGSIDTGTAALYGGFIDDYKASVTKAAPYNVPYIQMDFGSDKSDVRRIVAATLKADNEEQIDRYQYECTVYGKSSSEEDYTQLGTALLKRAGTQENSAVSFELENPVTVDSVLVTLDNAGEDCWPILREVEIYQYQENGTDIPDPDPEPSGELSNIAAECEITAPSEQAGKPASNMADGDTSTLWVNNGGDWPCQVEFALPKDNTKCVKKVVLKFESGHTPWSVDVALKYALNNVTSDLVDVEGSSMTAAFDDGYVFEFQEPQAMSHLYVVLSNPKNNGAAGAFWPAIAEAEIYIDNGAEEEVILENIANTRAKAVSLDASVNASADKAKITDGDFATSAALNTRTLAQGGQSYAEVSLGVDQRIRQFVIAMKEDASGAVYRYKLYGKTRNAAAYGTEPFASGTVGTSAADAKEELFVSDLAAGEKEVEYESVKVVFEAENNAAESTIPQLAEFQLLANKAVIVEADTQNIVWGSTALHSNYSQSTLERIVDGNTKNTWSASQYPAYVDLDLNGEYSLSEIQVYTPSNGYSQYSLYYSADGQNYTKLAEKTEQTSCPAEGESYDAGNVKACSVRILLEYNSVSEKAVLNEIRILGEKTGEAKKAKFEAPVSYAASSYNQEVTAEDTIEEVKGIVSRNVGEAYVDWFRFELGEEAADGYDYYEIEDADGKIKITGNDGVSLAAGLNYYLKYFCNVSITQVGSQIKMPSQAVSVGTKIHKECKVPLRYAYNYCTMSYSMAFWGEDEWRKELDWLALNGVNLVLDITGQEEVWREFLSELGYDHASIKDYIAGPAYYAWAYMANLSGYGGPVHDSWFTTRTELARKNQLIMRRLGMQPILQGYSGMVPVDVAEVAQGEYALTSNDVIAQGTWCSFQRPYMLRTNSDAYDKYAKLFYECQENVFGDVTDYYATDPFHEGGNTGNMNTSDVSSSVLDSMIAFDADAVWVIQAWQGNPSAGLVNGLNGRKEHALILDLYAEKTPHWNDSSYSGGKEFQSTPWVYCMLNNFGGRMGLHGHMDNLVSGVVDAANNSEKMTGIGITPEGSQNNPVLYDLLFETVWCDDAAQELTEIDTAEWLKKYVTRRYGAESENAYQAMRILEDTVYKASLNMLGQGAPESYINARPAESISAASTWGNAVISYDMEQLENAAKLLLADYDILKASDGYLYDLADILKQVLSNASQKYHKQMVNAYRAKDLEEFTAASDKFLALIDKVEEVLGTREEFLFGTWVERAKALAAGTDDFTADLYEFNAKSLVTTWGAYPQAISGGLKDYSNRQWAGLTNDFYKQRWIMWINQKKAELNGESTASINWFEFEWAFARANTEYTSKASGVDLGSLGQDVLENFSSVDRSPAADASNDYPVQDITVTAGSEEVSSEDTPAQNVIDGSSATIWHTKWSSGNDSSSYGNHYLILELKEETEIAGLRYLPRQDGSVNGIVTGYEISVSTDGVDYTTAAEGSWAQDTDWKLASFETPQRAKYVRFAVTQAGTNQSGKCFSSAAEVRVTVPHKEILVEGITLTAEKAELTVGETLRIEAKVAPEEADNKALIWSSSNPDAAQAAPDGTVTAKAAGTAVIRAQAADGSGVFGELTVNIKEKEPVKVESITLTAEKTELTAGETLRIEAKVAPEEAENKALIWSSANSAAAAVAADGTVTAKAAGTAVIRAQAADGSGIVGSIVLSIKARTVSVPEPELPKKGDKLENKNFRFQITAFDAAKRTVKVLGISGKKKSSLTIPDKVTIGGYTYTVTAIAPKAFRSNTKLTKVTIGKNIKTIGKQAFAGCRKLKKATIKSKVLTSVGRQAFQGMSAKGKVYVPKTKYNAYKKLLQKKAKLPKNIKIVKK